MKEKLFAALLCALSLFFLTVGAAAHEDGNFVFRVRHLSNSQRELIITGYNGIVFISRSGFNRLLFLQADEGFGIFLDACAPVLLRIAVRPEEGIRLEGRRPLPGAAPYRC